MAEVKIKTQEAIQGKIGTVANRWNRLDSNRTSVLNRARQCAELTIPALLPQQGTTENQSLPTPYQGLGSRAVNNLSSKLLLALLPTNSPFFKMAVDDFMLEKLSGQKGMRAEVETALNKIERAVMNTIETDALRVPTFAALKYLVALGNALVYLPPEGGMKVFRLDRYVVKRDPMGTVLEIIVKESVSPVTLPDSIKPKDLDPEKNLDLYTRIVRKGKFMEIVQECDGKVVPDSQGKYIIEESPWLALRWSAVDGEDYGRGLVEEYLGDLRSLEALTQAIVEGSAAAAKVLFLVKPNGTTRVKVLAESNSGDIKSGNADDVTVLQMNKFNDFRVALDTVAKLEQRLSQAFLLMSSVQRDAERVTAEEIRIMAGELEDALGGVYSVLSQEFQLPLVKCIMHQMSVKKNLPTLPSDTFKPMIVTGLEALGRGHDLNKLNQFLTAAIQLQQSPPEINRSDMLMRIGTSLGIDMDGMVKSKEEVAQEMQQQQMMQMMQQAAPGAINQLTKGAVDSGMVNQMMGQQAPPQQG